MCEYVYMQCNALYTYKKRKLLNCLNKPEKYKIPKIRSFFSIPIVISKSSTLCAGCRIAENQQEAARCCEKLKLFKCLSVRLEVSCFCRQQINTTYRCQNAALIHVKSFKCYIDYVLEFQIYRAMLLEGVYTLFMPSAGHIECSLPGIDSSRARQLPSLRQLALPIHSFFFVSKQ